MKAFDPNPALRWLFCFIHPDDELAICGWMRYLVRQGAEVHVAWTHHTPVREQEARAAAHRMGIPNNHLTFLDGDDGNLVDQLDHLLPGVVSVVERTKPDRVVTAAFEQGHLDHDATNLLVNMAWQGPILEVPLYYAYHHWYQRFNRFSNPQGQELWPLDEETVAFKKRLARTGYPSQSIWRILLWYEFGRVLRGDEPLVDNERMRWQTAIDFLTPNHADPLRGRIMECETWRRWVRAAEPFVKANLALLREADRSLS
jgi:hypothetical protein